MLRSYDEAILWSNEKSLMVSYSCVCWTAALLIFVMTSKPPSARYFDKCFMVVHTSASYNMKVILKCLLSKSNKASVNTCSVSVL